jgi:glycosyltransferase involved in cell wall biosynthesis
MTAEHPQPSDVSAVVCTKNSIASVEPCLQSLRNAGAGEIIVVDASSTDGTLAVADSLADRVLEDPGTGLGQARNLGIAASSRDFILNMGSDNVMPPEQLQRMLSTLTRESVAGVSAQTRIAGSGYVAFGLNTWRSGRFRPGPASVIGTPTLFRGDLLRASPFNPDRSFSDDSELCERWKGDFDATFAISDAYVYEQGKVSFHELWVRCRMYGVSDAEVFTNGRSNGWPASRQIRSLTHPLAADVIEPMTHTRVRQAAGALPFLLAFASMRYAGWAQAAWKRRTRAA